MRDLKLSIIACVALAFIFGALLVIFQNSLQDGRTERLSFWTGDGDHATEDMLIKYDSQSGVSYLGPLRNKEGIRFGWPSDFARVGKSIYGVDADRRRLYKLDGESGIVEPVGGRMRYQRVFGLAYDETHCKLYALDNTSRKLLLLDSRTGGASEVFTLPALHLDIRGLAFNSGENKLYYSDESTKAIYSCDPNIGTPQIVMKLPNTPQAIIEELEFYEGRLFASYVTFQNSVWHMQIMEMDPKLNSLHPIGPVLKDLSGHCLLINSMPRKE